MSMHMYMVAQQGSVPETCFITGGGAEREMASAMVTPGILQMLTHSHAKSHYNMFISILQMKKRHLERLSNQFTSHVSEIVKLEFKSWSVWLLCKTASQKRSLTYTLKIRNWSWQCSRLYSQICEFSEWLSAVCITGSEWR